MKLYLISGNDDDDLTNSFNWFVVATSVERARELWNDAIVDYMERDGLDKEIDGIHVILDDVTNLPIGKQGERFINWEEFPEVWKRQA